MGLFTGKKVVITAPAPHITEVKQDFSDYDFVCRVNAMIPLSEELIEATGDRVDVWFPANSLLERQPELCQYPKIIRTTKTGLSSVPQEYKSKVSIMNKHHDKLKITLESTPNRALRAIVDVLLDCPALLYVTGVTFYKTGGYYKTYGCYNVNDKAETTKGDFGGHSQERQLGYFVKEIAHKIKMDTTLEKIVKNYGKQTN